MRLDYGKEGEVWQKKWGSNYWVLPRVWLLHSNDSSSFPSFNSNSLLSLQDKEKIKYYCYLEWI